MGTTLTGTTPQDTYDSLIKVTDNGPISGTLKALSDGLGNDSTLSLSTTAASIAGTLAVAGAATFDTSTLVVDATNNRVGVGTASPDNALEVSASVGTSTSLVKLTNSSSAAPSNIAQVGFELANSFSGANTDIVFGAIKTNSGNYDSDFYISTSSGTSSPIERMRITAAGNVGIGTNNPTNKLQVVGNTYSEGLHIATGQFELAGGLTSTFYTFSNVATNKVFFVSVRQSGNGANNVMGAAFTFSGAMAAYNIAQDNTLPVLFLTIGASGLGLTLTTAAGYGPTTWEYTITQIK